MSGIYGIRLTDATVRVGPQLLRLEGFGDDKFTLAPFTDVGSFMSGVDGDTLHVTHASNGWLFTVTMLQGATGVTLLNTLHSTLGIFPIAVTYGLFSLTGVMNMISLGEVAASRGTTTRTMTAGVSKVTGNTDAAPGQLVPVF